MDASTDLVPADVAPPETAVDDPRVGHLLGKDAGSADVVLVGFPSDEGVRLNGGRPGAAGGPAAIRRRLYALTPDARCHDAFAAVLARTVDLGDVPVTGDVARDQERLGAVLAPHLARGARGVVLGGGHETTYGHFLGYVRAGADVAILNWDAHADVRPPKGRRPHSGSSFRLALEHPSDRCTGYAVAGLQPHSTARAHLRYVEARGGRFFWAEDCTPEMVDGLYEALPGRTLVTFDLDAVDQSVAPGVSAPAAGGLGVDAWLHAAEAAGRSDRVASVDVVECNPRLDVDNRTARLAALTVWHVLRGCALRAYRGG